MKAILSMTLVFVVCGLMGAQGDKIDPIGTWKCGYKIGDQMRTLELTIKKDGAQTCFDISQALAVGQLRKSHHKVLIPVRKSTPLQSIVIARHTLLKLVVRKMSDQFREDESAGVHHPLLRVGDAGSKVHQFRGSPFKSFPAKIPAMSLGQQGLSVFVKYFTVH